MSGLFGTFNIAKRGMFVQQKAIDVTSHNISNANTEGYSRQRALMETTTPFSMPSLNNAVGPGQMGTGSTIKIIERVRDSFVDYTIRKENSTLGQYEARDKYLSQIESIFNEPSDAGLSKLIGKFFDSWDQLSKQAESSNARTVVAQQSAALANELNHAYSQLEKVKTNAQEEIKNSIFNISSPGGILQQLNEINEQIRGVKVSGQEPNDLMDKRDLLLDQLSGKFNFDISQKQFYGNDVVASQTESVTAPGVKIKDPIIVNSDPNSEVRKFSYITSIQYQEKDASGKPVWKDGFKEGVSDYRVTYYKNGDTLNEKNAGYLMVNNIKNDGNSTALEKFKQIDQCRVLWGANDGTAIKNDGTPLPGKIDSPSAVDYKDLALFVPSKGDTEGGELQGYMSVQKDVDVYIEKLDKLAKTLAFAVNSIHSGQSDSSKDKMPFFVNAVGSEDDITAKNISVNKQILDNPMEIKTRLNDDKFDYASQNNIDGEKGNERALAIAKLRDVLILVPDIKDRKNFYNDYVKMDSKGLELKSNSNGMKIDAYFKDVVNKLGIQEQEARRIVGNQELSLGRFEELRDSTSGVSLDEEMANLIQYQHAYQANAKIISTVDQLLDVVVNGLKR